MEWKSAVVMRWALPALLLAAGACAKTLPPLPLRPQPVAYADTLPIPEPQTVSEGRFLRALTLHIPYDLSESFNVGDGEALNRTHFDDVVSSAWFERRIGYTDISPQRLAAAEVTREGAPAPQGKLEVKSGKVDGATPGFVIEDEKGDTYIAKFDLKDVAYLQSSVGIIVNRLMWAAGYYVPSDYLAVVDSARFTLAEGAEAEESGRTRPMTMDDVRRVLEKAATLPDGRFRVVASKYVPGKPKGPTFLYGVRADDPNDHYRHEHRRELRGLRVISSWLNDTDRREGNTMDVYVEPGYLRHYQYDFGAALGSSTDRPKHAKDDVERPVDMWRALARMLSLGFYREGWENDPSIPAHSGIGYFKAESYDPDEWKAAWDNPAFTAMTPADAYWGAKIVSSFTDEHLKAAVREGHLPEQWVADSVVSVLALRRDIVTRRYFSAVTPIEGPRVAASGARSLQLAFRDLGLDKGIWTDGATSYTWTLRHEGRDIERSGSLRAKSGEQLLDIDLGDVDAGRSLGGEDALAVLQVLAVRDSYYMDPEKKPRAATIWLRWNGSAARYEVVGLEH